jgi:erythromycin esterase
MPTTRPAQRLRKLTAFLVTPPLLFIGLVAAPAAHAAPGDTDLVTALAAHAYPLRSITPGGGLADLDPLADMVGEAGVVGFGEATHGSREFRTIGHRVFRYLVDELGFRTFALELNWSSALPLNDYVLTGQGDPRDLITAEMQNAYVFFATEEVLDLLEWMRSYNRQHPEDPVMFMGNDIAYPGAELFDEVTAYVADHRPGLVRVVDRLYHGIRPDAGMDEYFADYLQRPLAERQANVERAERALWLVRRLPAPAPEAHAWAVQHARVIVQVTTLLSLLDLDDDGSGSGEAAFYRYRDEAMAANTAWWYEQSGDRVLAYAHDTHIAYESPDPDSYPKTQGAFLRDRLGERYVAIGTTFNQGSFHAQDADDDDEPMREFTVGPAETGSNEYVLSQVRHRNYVMDLRDVTGPAGTWLDGSRPTRGIGTGFPDPPSDISLRQSFDILIHLDTVRATRFLS